MHWRPQAPDCVIRSAVFLLGICNLRFVRNLLNITFFLSFSRSKLLTSVEFLHNNRILWSCKICSCNFYHWQIYRFVDFGISFNIRMMQFHLLAWKVKRGKFSGKPNAFLRRQRFCSICIRVERQRKHAGLLCSAQKTTRRYILNEIYSYFLSFQSGAERNEENDESAPRKK